MNPDLPDWPFDQPRHCATFTVRQVMEGSEPILLVSHDEDDHGWQFVGRSAASVADAMMVALEEIVRHGPTVLEVADIEPGWQAVRDFIGGPWRRQRSTRDLEDQK